MPSFVHSFLLSFTATYSKNVAPSPKSPGPFQAYAVNTTADIGQILLPRRAKRSHQKVITTGSEASAELEYPKNIEKLRQPNSQGQGDIQGIKIKN